MNGRELVLKSRQRDYKGSTALLTAASLQTDHEAIMAAGVDMILINPLTQKMFTDAVHSLGLSKLSE